MPELNRVEYSDLYRNYLPLFKHIVLLKQMPFSIFVIFYYIFYKSVFTDKFLKLPGYQL